MRLLGVLVSDSSPCKAHSNDCLKGAEHGQAIRTVRSGGVTVDRQTVAVDAAESTGRGNRNPGSDGKIPPASRKGCTKERGGQG